MPNDNWGTLNENIDTEATEFTHILKGNVAGYIDTTNGEDSLLTFQAMLAKNSYEEDLNKLQYFTHPHIMDSQISTNTPVPTLYRNQTIVLGVDAPDYINIYNPILKDTSKMDIPMIITLRGTSGIWDMVKDISLGLKYFSNEYLNLTLSTVYAELDSILEILQGYVLSKGRPVHIISHSLGCMLSNYIAYKLLSVPSIRAFDNNKGVTQCMFNPYLLPDSAYEYFREVAPATYDAKLNLQIHTISNDYITGLVSTYGIGTVNEYTTADATPIDPTPVVSVLDMGIGSWLINTVQEITGSTSNTLMREIYLSKEHHSIDTFGPAENANSHAIYDTFEYLETHNISDRMLSIKTVRTKDLANYGVNIVHLYLADLENVRGLEDNDMYADYPHYSSVSVGGVLTSVSQVNNLYHWSPVSNGYNTYVLGINTHGNKSVSFPITLTNVNSNKTLGTYMFVPVGDASNKFFIYKEDNVLLGMNSTLGTSNLFNLPTKLITKSNGDYLALQNDADKFRFQFTLQDGVIFNGTRRTLEPTFPIVGILNTTMGQTPKLKVKIYNDIGGNRFYLYKYYGPPYNGIDLMEKAGSWGDPSVWTNQTTTYGLKSIWTIDWESVNTYFPATEPFLQEIYKIQGFASVYPTESRDLGDKFYWQGGGAERFDNSSIDTTTDNDNRYIQVIGYSGNPINTYQVHIYAYINGVLNYLEGSNRAVPGFHPTVLDSTLPTGVSQYTDSAIWYPVNNALMTSTNSNSVWTIELEP